MENEEQQATLADTLRESIATVTAAEPAPTVVPETLPAEAAPAEPKPGRTAGRARAEDGKLLPGKPVKPEIAAELPKPEAVTPSPAEAQPATPAATPIPRPSSWKKEMWPIWEKMNTGEALTPQEARQVAEYNAQRETQFATGVSTYKQIADSARPVMDAIAPFQADIKGTGMETGQFVHTVLSQYKQLAHGSPQQKLAVAHNLLRECGVPIQALYDQNAQQQYLSTPHAPQQAPQPQATEPEEVRFEKYLAAREVKQTVESMANDPEKYPFFHYVSSDMAQLLDSLEATDLSDAYEKALELPQHAMLKGSQQPAAAPVSTQPAANPQAIARAARASAVSPRSATPASAGAPDTGKKGVGDALRAAIAQHAGGSRV